MTQGRHSEFTTEMGDLICERLANGESLRAICADDDMPARATVFKWLVDIKNFSDQYAKAREAQADTLFDEVLEIADNARNDWMERRGEDDAGWIANGENIQRSRLRIDARKWMAGKLRPKKYGEKILNEHTGADGEPIRLQHSGELASLSADEREQLRMMVLARQSKTTPESAEDE